MEILLIDDHPMTLEGYVSILKKENSKFYKMLNCETFYKWIIKGNTPDIAIIDHDLPAYTEQKLFSGIECSLLIRKFAPNCKIIFITAHEQSLQLYTIYKKVLPDAFIVKSDFCIEIINDIVYNNVENIYLSTTVKKALKEINNKITLLDTTNREIIMYLSEGFKISQLEEFVHLSTSGIQKRVIKMLQEFEVKDYQELILYMKKQHLL